MPGPDTAVEEAPVLIGFLVALVEFLIAIQLLAMLWTYKHTIGYVLERFAVLLRFHVPWVGTVDLSGPVNALNDAIVTRLGQAAYQSQNVAGKLFHASADLQLWMVHETAAIGGDVFRWGEWLQRKYLPSWLKGALLSAFPVGFLTKLIVDQIRKHTHHQTQVAQDAAHTSTAEHTRTRTKPIEHKVAHVAKVAATAIPGALPLPWVHIFPRVESLENWRGFTRKRLRKLERVFAAAGAAAIMANALGLGHNWRCITRGNIGRIARHICGFPTWMVDLLVLGTVEAFILSDLCGFVNLMQKEATNIRPILMELVDVEDVLIGCHGTEKPVDFALPALSLPPMPAPSVLVAA